VVPEAIEGSLMLASHALALVGVPMRRVLRMVQDARDARYGLLRGYFHGADDDGQDERRQVRLRSVTLPRPSPFDGSLVGELPLQPLEVSVLSVRRSNGAVMNSSDELRLASGDTLVLSGVPEALTLAEETLLGSD
jgi:CPA2 family monovalent cation:H+ antiporter-2